MSCYYVTLWMKTSLWLTKDKILLIGSRGFSQLVETVDPSLCLTWSSCSATKCTEVLLWNMTLALLRFHVPVFWVLGFIWIKPKAWEWLLVTLQSRCPSPCQSLSLGPNSDYIPWLPCNKDVWFPWFALLCCQRSHFKQETRRGSCPGSGRG